MPEPDTDLEVLLFRWEEGSLTAAEQEALADRLEADASARSRLMAWTGFSAGLARELARMRQAATAQVLRPARRPRWRGLRRRPTTIAGWLAAAVAAGIALLALATGQAPETTGMRVLRCDGVITRTGGASPAPGHLLPPGTSLLVEGGATIAVTDRTGTVIEVSGPADLATPQGEGDHTPRPVALTLGHIRCRVAPQAPDRPFRVRTPHALMTVVGTVFTVDVDRDGTRLAVQEGRVHFRDLSGVDAGRTVDAGASTTASVAVAGNVPPAIAPVVPAPATAATPELLLFDGLSLAGWQPCGTGAGSFTVEDGAIVGRIAPGPNTYLRTVQRFTDGELTLEIRCDPGANSGVNLRSAVDARGVVVGLQCEFGIAQKDQTGRFYDEGRGEAFRDTGAPPAVARAVTSGWNRLRIVMRGDTMQSWVNGIPCSTVTGVKDRDGFIALQVRPQVPAAAQREPVPTVRFRDLHFRSTP